MSSLWATRRALFRAMVAGGCAPYDQIDGAVSVGQTFTHPADGVIAFDVDALPTTLGQVIQFEFRQQDGTNSWTINIFNSGAFTLYEQVGGSYTTRASASSVVQAGHRVVVVMSGSEITGYSGGVQRWTYGSAANFAAETDGEITKIEAGGAISDLKTWSLACRATEGV